MHIYSWHHNPRYDNGRVGILDHSLRTVFNQHALYYLRIFALYSVLLCSSLSIFYACYYRLSYFVHNVNLQVVDLDHGPVGRQITQLILSTNGQPSLISTITNTPPQWVEASMNSLDEASEFVRKHGWGAIVIAPNLSELVGNSIAYDPQTALTVLVSSGRNFLVSGKFVQPALEATAQLVVQEFATQHIVAIRSGQQPLGNGPMAIAPIGYTTKDVAPFGLGIAPVAPIFTLFATIACTLAAQILIKTLAQDLYTRINHIHLTISIHGLLLTWSTILALYSTLAFLTFHGPKYDSTGALVTLPFTVGRFFSVFAALNATLMASSQWLLLGNTLLPPDLVPIVFLSLITSSNASSIVAIDLAPHAVRWLVVVPSHCHASLLRYIVSGAHPQLARDISILLGEIFLMTAVNTIAIAVRQHWLDAGIADNNGWFRSSIFFKPKPTSNQEEEEDLHYTLFGE